jgi:transcriptional regulator with XRE-family HTH domain
MKVYSAKIKKELKRLGWTQTKLAERAGMTKQALSNILKRRFAQIESLNRIGEALGIDPRDLLK